VEAPQGVELTGTNRSDIFKLTLASAALEVLLCTALKLPGAIG
jgi:hypothetical protein